MTFESRHFRDVLGYFATGVAVVTAATPEGKHVGVTINSFNSVSITPELVQFSLGHQLKSLPAFVAARHYVVNFLSADQMETSKRFSQSGHDKWKGAITLFACGGAPILDGCLAYIDCERKQMLDVGDHTVFFCRAREIHSDPSKDPLVFYRGRYHALAAQPYEEMA